MKYIVIPPEVGPVPPITFDFAIEEFAARHFTDDDYCFIWQTRPTVIIGRNQLLVNEVNVDYCNANDVFIARRKSGGGAMYSDKGNVMFSFISSEPDVQKMFRWAMGKMADVLRDLGIDATLSGRNDIIVDGRKVAGAAFYRASGRGIMHNTLLFKSDVTALQNALTPSKEKLKSMGEANVPVALSWMDEERDVSTWLGNPMQQEAVNKLYSVAERVRIIDDPALTLDWMYLQASNNFRMMSTKQSNVGVERGIFSSPFDAFSNYMNILGDFLSRVRQLYPESIEDDELNSLLTTIRNQSDEIELKDKEASRLQARVEKLESENSKLHDQIDQLEEEVKSPAKKTAKGSRKGATKGACKESTKASKETKPKAAPKTARRSPRKKATE